MVSVVQEVIVFMVEAVTLPAAGAVAGSLDVTVLTLAVCPERLLEYFVVLVTVLSVVEEIKLDACSRRLFVEALGWPLKVLIPVPGVILG